MLVVRASLSLVVSGGGSAAARMLREPVARSQPRDCSSLFTTFFAVTLQPARSICCSMG